MARYSVAFTSKTMTAVADTNAMTDNGYGTFLQGGSATMLLKISEVSVSGESAASNPTTMVLGRDSVVGVTAISGNFNANLDAASTAPATIAVFGCVSTTKPQRSATLGRLLSTVINAYGGVYRWQARYGEEITVYGATQPLGEVSLSSVTGTGVVSGHLLYEVA